MANEKRERIMESAMKLFSEKGFFSTSVQEIAEKSGVAKGSIYKYFPSKEDLLISVFEFYQNEMFNKAKEIKTNPDLVPREVLIHQIAFQFDNLLKTRELIKMHFKELPNHVDNKIKPFMLQTRRKMMNWHKENFLFAFGDSISPYIWDIVVIFHGMLREYFSIHVFEGKSLDIQYTSRFIVERIEAIIKDLLATKPEPILINYVASDCNRNSESKEEQLTAILNEMRRTIEEKGLDELNILIDNLEEELKKENEKSVLSKAYLDYLGKSDDLVRYVIKLDEIINY